MDTQACPWGWEQNSPPAGPAGGQAQEAQRRCGGHDQVRGQVTSLGKQKGLSSLWRLAIKKR